MKDFTLSDKLNAIFNSGKSIRFQNTVKRKDGDWHSRIIWEEVELPSNRTIETCEWFGFETIDEAVEDCLTYLVITNLK
jgi:hypothetical protein